MFVNSPFNYTGNKYKLLDQLLPEFDFTKKKFIDLFCGSFVVSANVLDKFDEIIEDTKSVCPNKDSEEGYSILRESFNREKTPEKLWALMLSCTNNMLRFNQKIEFNQTWGKRTWNSSTDEKVENWKTHIRKHKDKISLVYGNFNDLKIDNENSFVYADPPYSYIRNIDGSMGNKQISEAGYNAFWKKQDDINLLNYLIKHDEMGGTFAISGVIKHKGSECWILNELVDRGFNYKELNFNYNKVSRKDSNEDTIEIIVKNF